MKISILAGASLVTATLVSLAAPTPARAQQDGESRCGADGYVERYAGYTHSWRQTLQHCAGNSGSSSRGRSENGGGGEPQDGDTKCGADGKVYTFYGSLHHWSGGIMDCR